MPGAPVKKILLLLLLTTVVLIACRKESFQDEAALPLGEADQVNFDLDEVPYPTLSAYRFFKARMKDQVPVTSVLPYAPITSLFTDYAHKARFVWMPPGVKAQYNGDHNVLEFPDGAVLIKTFFYDNVQPSGGKRIIETRLLFKRNGLWEFADYVWNADQTEAYLDLNGSNTPVSFTDDSGTQRNIIYRIPSSAECQTCHKINADPIPIGPKPQNLNAPLAYADGVRNQLVKWVEKGYLAPGYPKNILTTVRWDDPAQDLQLRVRSYLDMNCAHCHADERHCNYRPMRFAFNETTDQVNLGECVPPDDPVEPSMTYIVARGNTARSMLHYRLIATDEAVRMPLLGRTIVHDEGVQLISTWITSLSPPCN